MSDEVPTVYWIRIQGNGITGNWKYRQECEIPYRNPKYIHTLDYSVANIFKDIIPYIVAPADEFIVHNEQHPEIIRQTEAKLIEWVGHRCKTEIIIDPDNNEFVNSPLQYDERFWSPRIFNGVIKRGDFVRQSQCIQILNKLSMLYPFIDEYRINQTISGPKPIVQYQ